MLPDERVLLKQAAQQRHQRSPAKIGTADAIEWRAGELEWEAWMRVLDQAGVRTGHVYRCASMRPQSAPNSVLPQTMTTSRHSDIEQPPSASGAGECG